MKIEHGVFVALLFLSIFLLSFYLVVFDTTYYFEQVASEEGVAVFAYLDYRQELDVSLFTKQEIIHLQDVRSLLYSFRALFFSVVVFTLFLAVYLFFTHDFQKRDLILGGGLGIAALVIIGVLTLFAFDRLFTWFHLMSFSNTFWLLPENSYLLQLFPFEYFQVAFTRILVYFTGFSVFLIFFGWILRKLN